MIQCPKCGTEYTVPPDVCAQCGCHLTPEDSLPDLFDAAMQQEKQSRAQQQAQREAFRKLHAEKHPKRQTVPEKQPEPQPDETETAPVSEQEAIPQTANSTAAQPKPHNKKRMLFAIAAIAVLVVAAIICLRDGFKPVHHPSDNYAFYLQDSAIWFYRDDTGKKLCLTDSGKPKAELPDSCFQKLTQLSPDGKRVYYPLDFTDSETCRIAYRDLAAPEEAHVLTRIRMFPEAQRAVQETGRPGEAEAFRLTDMLPPYIIDEDVLFYINPDGALCRLRSGGSEEVLADAVVRYWKVSGEEGIYYLALNDTSAAGSVNNYSAHMCPNAVGVTVLPWSVTEYSTYGSCTLFTCKREGESECYYPFPEISIENWAVPYADSDRYFYFCQRYDENRYLFVQSDLKTPHMYEIINMTGDYSTAAPQLLCAYPDGSFYYATFQTPMHASDENVSLHYFKRKEDQTYQVLGFAAADYLNKIDICRTAPYLSFCHDTMEKLYLFSGPYSAVLNVPADAERLYGKRVRFDTQYPVSFLYEDNSVILKMLYAFSSDSRIAEKAQQAADEQSAYYCMPDGWAETEFSTVSHKLNDGIYFAYQPKGSKKPEIFCWNPESGELLLPDGQHTQADKIIRKDGSLFCRSKTDGGIYTYRENAMQKLTAEEFRARDFRPVSGNTFLAIGENGMLVLCTSEKLQAVDQADCLLAAGRLPKDSESTTEVPE